MLTELWWGNNLEKATWNMNKEMRRQNRCLLQN